MKISQVVEVIWVCSPEYSLEVVAVGRGGPWLRNLLWKDCTKG